MTIVMEIQRLNDATKELLENVAPDVFDHDICPASVEAFVNCPRHVMVLAVDAGQVVGMASGVEYFHPDKPRQFWVNEVGVTPERQNEGIGRTLVQALISVAEERSCVYAWLGTEQTNAAGNRCFSSVPNGEPPSEFMLYEWPLQESPDIG